jgi:aspartate/methionine/tyrosine aminotransferase
VSLNQLVPKGASYIRVDVASLACAKTKQNAMYLSNETIAVNGIGKSFFVRYNGDSLVRICHAKPMEFLRKLVAEYIC